MLDATGFLSGTDVHLTLSFAADGTQIAGQSNQLATTFDAIAPSADWQEAILNAFQTWAVNTNADVGVVADGGQPFGTPGPMQRDSRFGDIRIGAIAMAPNVGAVSVPVERLVSGTWFADVLFNTAYNFQSLDDIFAIALHETGNVFGLKDNTDPNSPLFPSDPPVVRLPTATDIALLQELHGTRSPDFNEASGAEGGGTVMDNDSFVNSTELKVGEIDGGDSGSAPTVVYGDITDNSDLDYFVIDAPDGYDGGLTVEVRSEGISLLTPRLRVFDTSEQLLGEALTTAVGGNTVSVHLTTISSGEQYHFEVSGVDPGILGIGGYSLVATFDDSNLVDQATTDLVAGGAFRFLDSEELAKFFNAVEDFYNDDLHTDDELANAVELETVPGFVEGTRYSAVGSITDSADVDYYVVKSALPAAIPLDVMSVSLRSLDAAGLVPRVTILDEDSNLVASTILANGGGDYIVQVDGVTAENDYLIKVQADSPGELFDTGNYNLVVTFGGEPAQFESLGLNPLPTIGNGVTQRIHTLYIGKPQLFHFLLEAVDVAVTTPTVLVASIFDDQGAAVHQFAARPGETRSREAVLLAPGSYTMRVVVLTLDGSISPEISYDLRWLAISDPFVGDPDDPTSNPFACTEPGMEGLFCYPGDITSNDPFLWDTFIDSLSAPPENFSPEDTFTLLFGDWWTWVWTEFGTNGPVFANDDTYHSGESGALIVLGGSQIANLSALSVPGPQGLLSNDIDPEHGEFIAMLQDDVSHGTLVLATDGGFTYTPDSGFRGMDQFTYTAYDFSQQSNTGTVRIVIGDSGDFDANGSVDGFDFLAWQRGYGITSGATLSDGDADLDFAVGASDLAVWESQYQDVSTPKPSNGDADGDGDFDGLDFLAWQRGFGITDGATAADGDANADGAVNSADLAIWESNYATGSISALTSTTTASPSQQQLSAAVSAAPANNQLHAVPLSATSTSTKLSGSTVPLLLSQELSPLLFSRATGSGPSSSLQDIQGKVASNTRGKSQSFLPGEETNHFSHIRGNRPIESAVASHKHANLASIDQVLEELVGDLLSVMNDATFKNGHSHRRSGEGKTLR